jgi:hypothetical protein
VKALITAARALLLNSWQRKEKQKQHAIYSSLAIKKSKASLFLSLSAVKGKESMSSILEIV